MLLPLSLPIVLIESLEILTMLAEYIEISSKDHPLAYSTAAVNSIEFLLDSLKQYPSDETSESTTATTEVRTHFIT